MRERAVQLGRIAFGVLAAVALCVQGQHAVSQGSPLTDFFSYFTILSNIAGLLVLVAGGVLALRGSPGIPDAVRGAIVLYMTITGLVYALLLSGYSLGLLLPWVDDIVHRVMPVVYLADWLLMPPARRIDRTTVLKWLVFPLVYLAYTLARGPLVHWYPYPFLDPHLPGGYGRVAGACTLMLGLFVLVAAVLAWLGNRLGSRRRDRPPPRHARSAPGRATDPT
ncbi:Pr6Pr family membrane protein [Kitasatospora sp. NPDC048540]|uniref:Pr6Pr family membrane protein n=1 Tax=unclassified Kitasatospora TaxID=2633591 RepID=UPI0006918778|nr:Pr6Pr family membrane protein [Kitasatospora sp. MBT63]